MNKFNNKIDDKLRENAFRLGVIMLATTPFVPSYAGTACRRTAWDPATWNGAAWKLSNNNLTATSPDNDSKGSINQNWATTAIPNGTKVYWEIKVSGAKTYTAFGTGFGEKNYIVGPNDYCTIGRSIPNGVGVNMGYNNDIVVITDNNGSPASDVIYGKNERRCDPKVKEPPPNLWKNGDIIGIAVDRVGSKFSYTQNGVSVGGALDMPSTAGNAFLPAVMSWWKSGPVATINGGSRPFSYRVPAGYTALDQINCAGANVVTVYQPSPQKTGNAVVISGKETSPAPQVYLVWRTTGVPAAGGADWVKTSKGANGAFSAPMTIDHPGKQSTLYYYATTNGVVTTPVTAAWSGTPSNRKGPGITHPAPAISN